MLAHRLVDELGVDLVYGHSSHHIRGLELYHGKLILYGAGDLINDYEGFSNAGDEAYSRQGAIFAIDIDPHTGCTLSVVAIPTLMDSLSLRRVTRETRYWQPNDRRFTQEPLAIERLARRVNALSRRDVGDDGAPLIFHVEDAKQCGVEPNGPVLAWRRQVQ